jgi:hypothetical protein
MGVLAAIRRLVPRLRSPEPYRQCILDRLPKHSTGAEIGVYKGEFSEMLVRTLQPKKLHLIDPWKFEVDPDYERSWYGGTVGKNQKSMDDIYDSVVKKFRRNFPAVEIHRNGSAQCSVNFPDGYFDWIYIDGNHQYEFVKQDLELYFAKVKPGGLVSGDDYGNVGWWDDGVTRAVDEAIGSGRYHKILIENHQFLLEKKS